MSAETGRRRIAVLRPDADAPITCTADRAELTGRAEQLERLRSELQGVERTDHGLLLRFAPSSATEAELQRFAADEQGCCRFWSFAVTEADGALALRWEGPPEVTGLLDRLHAWFEGDEPLELDPGLL